jgi:hypothetical protein
MKYIDLFNFGPLHGGKVMYWDKQEKRLKEYRSEKDYSPPASPRRSKRKRKGAGD